MPLLTDKVFLTNQQQLGILHLFGSDAQTFLQGQLTCDVTPVTSQTGTFGACCDPKGRMLASFFLWGEKDSYYLLLPKNMLEITLNHLKKYVIRSKVNLQIISDLTELITPLVPADENTWRLQNIKARFVWIYPETRGLIIPQMVGLEKIGGVSLKKGCYVGQEVIARTENLGKLKRHLYQATTVSEKEIHIGQTLMTADKQSIGVVVEVVKSMPQHYTLLAVIQDQLLLTNTVFVGPATLQIIS